MKEIIFWFDNHKIRNYWLDYAIDYLKKHKVNTRETNLAVYWDINQYWVEDLFDNNFEEFFLTFIKENFNGEKRN